MKKLGLLICLIASAFTANARLGETPAEITTRYGKMKGAPEIVGTNLWTGQFRHAGYDVTVTFWNGKAVEEYFRDTSKIIPEDDAAAIFRAVSGEGKVTARTEDSRSYPVRSIFFSNVSNGVTGLLSNVRGTVGSLIVTSKDYDIFASKKSDEEKKKKLAGF